MERRQLTAPGPGQERDDATETEGWLAEQVRLIVLEEGRGL